MTPKLYCLRPACVWRTADNVCTWTVCPYGKRVQAAPESPPQPPAPREQDTVRGRRGTPVIGTDGTGKEHRYRSISAAARAHGVSANAVSQAVDVGCRAAGMYWRYDL